MDFCPFLKLLYFLPAFIRHKKVTLLHFPLFHYKIKSMWREEKMAMCLNFTGMCRLIN